MVVWGLICAYNEEGTIESVIHQTRPWVTHLLVVDDGSTDYTPQRVLHSGALLLRLSRNGGKGAALQCGFSYLQKRSFDYILTLDADGQHDPQVIPALIKTAQRTRADLILGSRYLDRAPGWTPRQAANWISSKAIHWLYRTPLTDSQSGLRLIKKSLLPLLTMSTPSFAFETEMILRAIREKRSIQEIPIPYIPPHKSSFRPVRDSLGIAGKILTYLFYFSTTPAGLSRGG